MKPENLERVHTHTHTHTHGESSNKKELEIKKFDVEMSTLVKGIAIIFMIIHHLFAFPAWYIKGIDYSNITILGKSLPQCMLYSVKICVNMFAFITGYAYFYNKTPNIKYGIKKSWGLLKRYWFILFAIFIPIAVLYNHQQISKDVILFNLFALDRRIVTFSWYIYFFVVTMLTLPFIIRIFNGKKIYEFIFPIACFTSISLLINYIKTIVPNNFLWIVNDINNILYCYPCIIVGYLVAKYDLFNKVFNKYLKPKYLWQAFIIVLLVLGCRSKYEKVIDVNLDIIYVPIIIYALIIIFSNTKIINKIVKILGKNSLNLWLLHSIIFANAWVGDIFQEIAFLPKNPILVVVWVFIILLPISICINTMFRIQENAWKKIKEKVVNKQKIV